MAFNGRWTRCRPNQEPTLAEVWWQAQSTWKRNIGSSPVWKKNDQVGPGSILGTVEETPDSPHLGSTKSSGRQDNRYCKRGRLWHWTHSCNHWKKWWRKSSAKNVSKVAGKKAKAVCRALWPNSSARDRSASHWHLLPDCKGRNRCNSRWLWHRQDCDVASNRQMGRL